MEGERAVGPEISARQAWFVARCLVRPGWPEQIQRQRSQRMSGESRAGIWRGTRETSEEWCLRRWAMYFALDPVSRPKSTWQTGQATERLEEERPRDVPIGREIDRAWLDGGEERGWEEGEGSRGGLELEEADGEA